MKKNEYLDNYWKTIICDVDDTISISTTHDWENAIPNIQVINKINKLYDDGWTIILMTARGQVSCNYSELNMLKKIIYNMMQLYLIDSIIILEDQ